MRQEKCCDVVALDDGGKYAESCHLRWREVVCFSPQRHERGPPYPESLGLSWLRNGSAALFMCV